GADRPRLVIVRTATGWTDRDHSWHLLKIARIWMARRARIEVDDQDVVLSDARLEGQGGAVGGGDEQPGATGGDGQTAQAVWRRVDVDPFHGLVVLRRGGIDIDLVDDPLLLVGGVKELALGIHRHVDGFGRARAVGGRQVDEVDLRRLGKHRRRN